MRNKIIITADWHIRKDVPPCRRDEDWLGTQYNHVKQIITIANNNNADIVIVGDIFEYSYNQPASIIAILFNAFNQCKTDIYILPGNHDLLYHNISNIEKSSIGLLYHLPNVKYLGKDIYEEIVCKGDFTFIHKLTYPSRKQIPPFVVGATCPEDLLEEYETKYILTGDYHDNFVFEDNGRYVINSGCLNIQKKDKLKYTSGFYILNTETSKTTFIEIEKGIDVICEEELQKKGNLHEDIRVFIEKLKNDGGESGLNFIENLKIVLEKNDIDEADRKYLTDKINQVMGSV